MTGSAFKMLDFVINFVAENDLATEGVVRNWTKHAEDITDLPGVKQWLGFVKVKIGLTKYKEIQLAWENECREDCGFEDKRDSVVLVDVLSDMATVATTYTIRKSYLQC